MEDMHQCPYLELNLVPSCLALGGDVIFRLTIAIKDS